MKRTTIYLGPELELLLKNEAHRRKRPVAEIIREAVQAHLSRAPTRLPPGMGAFDSGHTDTAERAEELLGTLGFGRRRRA